MVSFTGAGSCILDANQAGNTNYNAAAQKQQTVTVGKGAQTVTYTSTAPAATVGGATYTPTATATSGLAVTFTVDASSTAGACSIASGVVSFTGAGSCIVDANQAGNTNYNAAPQVQQTVTVAKGAQTITITSTAPAATVGGATYTPTATATSGLAVTFTIDASSTAGACTIASGVVSFTGAGSCVLDANQAGNTNYSAAAQKQQTVTVGKGTQTVTITSTAPAATVGGATYTPTATATSGLAVTFTIDASSTAGACTIASGVVSFTGAGSCVLDANQAGNTNYSAAAQKQQTVTVAKGSQTVTFTSTNPGSVSIGGTAYTPTATATSGLAVTISLDASSTGCTLVSGVVHYTAVGTCLIDANQAGNTNYNAAPQVQQSISVGLVAQTITYTSTAPAATVGGATYTPTATATSGLTVTFTIDASSTAGACTIASGVVSFTGAGSCVIDANQAGNATYAVAPQVQQTVTVAKANQTITITSTAPAATVGGPTYTLAATGGASGNPVTFTIDASSTAGACTIASGVVSFTGAGSCIVDANQAGNTNYNAAPQVQQTVTVAKANQTITITSTAPAATVGGPTYTVTATGGASGNPVTFTIDASSTAGACTIASGVVSFTGAGSCVIDANQAGNTNYNAAAQKQQTVTVAKANQTVTITSTAPAATVGGATYTPTATATSGLAVTFTIDASSTGGCSVTAGVVSFTGTGSCVIDANQAGNTNYNAAPQVQQTVTVAKGAQTITITSTAPAATVGGATYTPAATATSGLAVTFTIDASSTGGCSVTAGVVSFTAAGSCVLDANQAGNTNYNAAAQVQQTVTVAKANQTITITSTAPAATVGGATYTVTATGGASGNPVTFTIDASSTAGACTIASGVVSFTGAGSCIVDANQAGNANYNAAAQVQQTVTVAKGAQTVTITSTAPAATVGGATYTPTATATSGLAVTFTIDASSTAGACTIASGVVSFTGAGSCIVDANQAGNTNYNAAPQKQQTVTVAKANQTVTITSTAPAATVGGPTYTLAATATSGLAVTFTIDASSTGGCSVTAGVVSFTAAGSCVIDANQAGNANYNAAPQVQQTVTVAKANQTVTITSTAPAATVGGPTYTLAATGGASGNPVTYSIDASSTAGACSVTAGVVSFTGAGSCIVDANQAGNTNYNAAAQVQQTVTVAKANQTVTITSTAPAATVGGPTYTLAATGGASGNPVTYSIDASSTGGCSVTAGVVGFTAAGSCVIDANQAGNANYNAAPQVQQTVTVSKANQTITITSTAPAATVGGPTYTLAATGGASGNPVTYSIDASSTGGCSVTAGVVGFTAAGSCVIDANQAGNANYNAAPQVQQTVTVGKATQTITFTSTAPGSIAVGGTPYTPTATASSGLTVTITLDASSTGCTLTAGVVHFTAAGTCLIDANQAGNTNYSAAPQKQQTIAVGLVAQTITFTSTAPAATVGGATYTVTATGGASGNPVTFTIDASSTAGACSIASGVVSFTGAGSCIVDANQAGNGTYAAAPQVQQTVTVGKANQTVTITSTAPAATVGGATYTLAATGGASGNPVTYSIDASSTGGCSVTAGVVSFTAAGSCVIDANQAGNANYNAAPQVQQTVTVGKANQTITITSTAPAATVGGPTYTLAATGGASGNPVTYSIDASSTGGCSVTAGVVSFTAAGSCVIDANQAGNANYNAAPQVQQTVTVAKANQTITITSTAPAATVGGPTYTLAATGGASGNPVTYSIDASSTGGCSVTAGVVHFTAAGSCVIDANQAGNTNYNAAPQVQQTVTVGKGAQTVTFTSTAPAATVGGASYAPTATATSGLAVTFTIDASSTAGCAIAGGVVSFTAAGSCVIDANQAGNTNYNAAAQVQQTVTVGKGAQTVTFTSTNPGSVSIGGTAYTPTATATSGLTVTITLDASSTGCTLTAGVVHFTATGTCLIDANQAGNANYNAAAQVQQSISVGLTAQTITVTSTAPAATVGGATYTPAATATSGLAVTFTIDASSTAGACSIASGVVSFTGAGSCIVDANQAGNTTYAAAPQVQQTVIVGKGTQTITITSTAPAATVGGPTYTLAATGGASGNPVTYSIDASSTGGCSVTAGVVGFTAAGSCVVDANQAGNANYNAAPQVQQTVTVAKANQTITITSTAPAATVGGASYTPTATGGASGNPVTFTVDASSTAGACSVTAGVVSFTGAGSCIVDANQAGNANYNAAAQVQQTVTVAKANQTITITSTAPAATVGGPTYTLAATGGASGNPVTYSIDASSTGGCSVTAGVVSFTAAGSCVIDANQAGNASYNAAPQVQQTVTVAKATQTITITSTAPAATVGGATYTPTATGGASGWPVTYSIDASSTAGACIIASGVVSFTAAGSCVVDANQAGNANYNAAPQVQQTVTVGKGSQTVTFTSTNPGSVTTGSPDYTPTASSSAGLTVSISLDASSSGCLLISGSVSFTGAGTCVIDANQAGNANYDAAVQVQQSIAVGLTAQTVTFTSTAPTNATVGGATYTLAATGGASGNPVTFTVDASSTAGACSVTSAVVSFTGAGSCVIDANQAGNVIYAAAPEVEQTVTVGAGSQTVTFASTAPGDAVAGGPDYTPTATASSALPVALTIDASSSSVCAITAGVVSFTGAGSCVIDANQAGNANYDAAPLVQQTFTVAKASQTVTFTSTAPTGATFGGPAYSPTASASSSLPVTVTVDASSSAVCAIVAGSVSFTGTGTCTLDANQSGSANYDAAPQVQQAFTVAKASQTVTFASTAPTNATVGGATYTPIASASSSLPVALSLDASSAGCALSGGVVRFTGVGTCVIDANQSGSANYDAAAQVQQTFGVVAGAPGAPTIGTATGGNGDATVTWTAPASNGSPITGYTVTAYQGGTAVGTVPAGPSVTSVVYPGLTDGTAYTFTVTATNSVNSGAPSGHSNSVTPRQPGPTAVSGLSVSLSNPYAGLSTSLTVRFTTSASGALGAGGTILVGAVVGSVLPTSASDYSISVTGPGSPAATVSSVVVPPGQPDSLVQLTLGTSTIGNGDTVTITIAGVTNSPTADPSSVLIMKTSSDVTFVSAFYALYGPGFTQGYWMAASDGGVFSYGGAAFYGSTGSLTLNKPIEGMTATADGKGYWMVASDGGVFAFGDAGFYGSTGSMTLNSPIVGMAVTPDGKGYWLVAADGGLFSYGDAGFYGSLGGQHLNEPIVAMAATPDGKGYWMTASDGGIFAFGDAGFYGSAGSLNLNKPIEGMTATPDGKGYWLVASDGGVFAYGDAQFHGSAGSLVLNSPIVGMATNVQSGGYYLVAADGGMFSYDAPFYGSLGGQHLNKPIVAMAS